MRNSLAGSVFRSQSDYFRFIYCAQTNRAKNSLWPHRALIMFRLGHQRRHCEIGSLTMKMSLREFMIGALMQRESQRRCGNPRRSCAYPCIRVCVTSFIAFVHGRVISDFCILIGEPASASCAGNSRPATRFTSAEAILHAPLRVR
jgi:hypothetical protein